MKNRTGATLVELLLIVVFLSVGIAVASVTGKQYGLLGYVGGLIAGTVGSGVLLFALGFTFAFTFELLTGMPAYPVCSNGKCRDGESSQTDYRLEDSTGQVIAWCRCGLGYVKKGRRVVRIHADGSEVPYMIWKPLRGWFPDERSDSGTGIPTTVKRE